MAYLEDDSEWQLGEKQPTQVALGAADQQTGSDRLEQLLCRRQAAPGSSACTTPESRSFANIWSPDTEAKVPTEHHASRYLIPESS